MTVLNRSANRSLTRSLAGSLTLSVRRHRAPYVLALGLAVWAAAAFRLGQLRHDRFATFGFDLAIHDQAIWLLAHLRDPFITIRGMDTFGHHFTPIYWLLAPISWLGGGPHALLMLQIAGQLLGGVALYLLTVDLLGTAFRWMGVLIAGAFLLHPTNGWLVWEFFHPEVLALGPLLMAYRAARTQRWRAFAMWGLIAACTKEDMMLALAMIGLSVVLPVTKDRLRGLGIFAIWAGAYLIAARAIGTWRAGGPPPYETYYQPYGDSQFSVLFHFVAHPGDIWSVLFDGDRREYFKVLLVPAGALLPLIGWRGFAIGLPVLFGNLAVGPGYPYTHDYRFHYSAIVLAAIFLGVVESMVTMQSFAQPRVRSVSKYWYALPAALLAVTTAIGYYAWSPGPGARAFRAGAWPIAESESVAALFAGTIDVDRYGNTEAKRAALNVVPPEAATSAMYNMIAHLSHREGAYEWPNPWIPVNWGLSAGQGRQADPATLQYIVLEPDVAFGTKITRSGAQFQQAELFEHLMAREFEVVFGRDGVIVAKRIRPPECFVVSSALQSMLGPAFAVERREDEIPSELKVCPVALAP